MEQYYTALRAIVDMIGEVSPDTPHGKLKYDCRLALDKMLAELRTAHASEAAAPDLLGACDAAHTLYGNLHDALSDAIEAGRIRESDIPDDFRALIMHLERADKASEMLCGALKKARGE